MHKISKRGYGCFLGVALQADLWALFALLVAFLWEGMHQTRPERVRVASCRQLAARKIARQSNTS